MNRVITRGDHRVAYAKLASYFKKDSKQYSLTEISANTVTRTIVVQPLRAGNVSPNAVEVRAAVLQLQSVALRLGISVDISKQYSDNAYTITLQF